MLNDLASYCLMSSIRDFCKQLKKSIVSQILMGSENLLQVTSEVAGGVKRAKEAQFPSSSPFCYSKVHNRAKKSKAERNILCSLRSVCICGGGGRNL
jgi:hypothetical protein